MTRLPTTPVPGGLLEDFRRARSATGRTAHERYLIEGLRLHERALRSAVVPEAVLLSERLLRDGAPRAVELIDGLRREVPRMFVVAHSVVEEFTEGRGSGAVVGLIRRPQPPSLSDVLQPREACDAVRLLVAVDVEDPGNVGALVRTALAAGAAALVSVGCGDPFHPKAVRTSMGSLFRLPLPHVEHLGDLLAQLRRRAFHCVAAVSRGGVPPARAGLQAPRLALFVGSEAHGLPAELLPRVDRRVTIPMPSAIDSYSVNAAAAVLLYEAARG